MGNRIAIAKVQDIPPNESRVYPIRNRTIAVFNQHGTFYAIDDFCPHMGASLGDGWVEDDTVACPWHAWRFSLKDGCWLDNPRIKVDTFPVTVEDDDIYIEVPDDE